MTCSITLIETKVNPPCSPSIYATGVQKPFSLKVIGAGDRCSCKTKKTEIFCKPPLNGRGCQPLSGLPQKLLLKVIKIKRA
jgi:hypothetical protein